MKYKLLYIYKPYLTMLVVTSIVYTLLHWIIFIKFKFLNQYESSHTYLSLIFGSGFGVLIFMKSRLDILRSMYSSILLILIQFQLMMVLIGSTDLFSDLTGGIRHLKSANEIAQVPESQFYTLQNYYIDKQNYSSYMARLTWVDDDRYTIFIYYTMPVFESKTTTKTEPLFWLGIRYLKKMNTHLTENEKNALIAEFVEECKSKFDETDVSVFHILERVARPIDAHNFQEAIRKNPKYKTNDLVLTADIQSFRQRIESKVRYVFFCFGSGAILFLFILSRCKLNTEELDLLLQQKAPKKKAGHESTQKKS